METGKPSNEKDWALLKSIPQNLTYWSTNCDKSMSGSKWNSQTRVVVHNIVLGWSKQTASLVVNFKSRFHRNAQIFGI